MPEQETTVIDCCVKNCDTPATLGMTLILFGMRVELYFCEEHYAAYEAYEPAPLGPEGDA